MKKCDCCKKEFEGNPIIVGYGHELCEPCFNEFIIWWDKKESPDAPANIQQQVQADPTDSLT
jgi:hypothetical protein